MHLGVFKKRYKRFFADILTEQGEELTLHCPNTGAMTGLLQPYCPALFSLASAEEMKKRKTPGTLEALQISVGDVQYWVGVNTHRANYTHRTRDLGVPHFKTTAHNRPKLVSV
jgi:sugar fermentation stimulation protein A